MPSPRTTRTRILDVALDVLGQDPDASMADVATAAGVVRRTVYGHFPSRTDLVLALAEQAATELQGILAEVAAVDRAADATWADFVAHIWPVARRYRVLLALRRSEHGAGIHALLAPVDQALADLVRRGQDDGTLGRHLPALVLGQLAYATVFTVAETALTDDTVTVASATTTSLLVLGVPTARAEELARA
ncbi:TetR/AcrR family transcriptional regulator [Klenkia soli]|uniref:TetR/AcrR family transcriptional regulator n=1 Tax=Klenkia soli TaxID=1052260 RepID=UPI000B2570FD|nr:TetR/AcrR family transcriptional regulator [Klenkia soli]